MQSSYDQEPAKPSFSKTFNPMSDRRASDFMFRSKIQSKKLVTDDDSNISQIAKDFFNQTEAHNKSFDLL